MESKRTTCFLMGIILVLSVLFVAFEYSGEGSPADIDDDFLKDLTHEEEDLIPLITRKELHVALPERQAQVSDALKVTEETVEQPMPDDAGTAQDKEENRLPDAPEQQEKEEKTEEQSPQIANAEDNPLNFRVVENLPEFPGGAVEFMKWLTKNLQYPKEAQRGRVQGRVVAQFIVNADGSISDLRIVTSLDPVCDREVLRVLGMMPKWKAGMHNDKPCRTMVAIPIVFKL